MRQMKDSFDMYPEQVVNLSDQREGHGILLLTESLCVRFIDGRARKLCHEIRGEKGRNHANFLPVSLMKMCGEIKDLLRLRNHSKDWEEFSVKRVVKGTQGQIFVCGIGLPYLIGMKAGILLTLDYIGTRARPRLQKAMEHFNFTPREVTVVQNLLRGGNSKQIADMLTISVQTVKEHFKHIMEKTHSSTRTGILFKLCGNG
jgi:DNA-binding CsgD family transcriptional regulator